MPDDENKSPLDSVVELFVFAPLGLALTARDSLPDLIARGKQQWRSQSAMAKVMGEYAVGEAEKRARKRLDEVTETLTGLGVFPTERPAKAPAPARRTAAAPTPDAADDVGGRGQANGASPNGVSPNAETSNAETSNAETSNAVSPNGSAAVPPRASADLAIPGYDTLSASQVVQRLAGLAATELEAVREYEIATRGRRTILSKIAQLQAAETGQ
jgi:hypothetical protein